MTQPERTAQLMAATINDPTKNPYLVKQWTPDEIVQKAAQLPPSIVRPWIKTMQHLQAIAWRSHASSCTDPQCPGCESERVNDQMIRCYFHRKQAEFIAYDGKEGWCITGRRFGKTEALVFLVVCRLMGYNPLTNELYQTPQKWWLVGLDFPMVRDRLIPGILAFLPQEPMKWHGDREAFDVGKTDSLVTLFNDSVLGFKSADSGMSKFQALALDGVGFDEECDEQVYKESKMRVPGGRKRLIIRGAMSPDPMKGLTWSYKALLKNPRQADPSSLQIWTGSIGENPGISPQAIADLEAEMEPWERAVRLHGQYDVGRGRNALPAEALMKLLEGVREPIRTEPMAGGVLSWWEEIDQMGCYGIGADPAEGLAHGDNTVAQILKREAKGLTLVASLVGKIDPDVFGVVLVELAKRCNQAYLLPELNNHGFTVVAAIRRLLYPYLYSPSSIEDSGMTENRKWGWVTSATSKPILVDGLIQALREGTLIIYDRETLDECLTFILGADGKAQAQQGCKDDRVMALGLAIQAHLRCPLTIRVSEQSSPKALTHEERKRRELIRVWDEDPTRSEGLAWVTA